jgi:AraC-like DNA-binding protein
VACRSLLGSHAADGERTVGIVGLIADKSPRALPALLAYIHDLLGALFAEPPNGMLAAIPDDAQPVLVGLMKQVKAQPAADWSLKAAAAAAEYSAFHLSRTFRAAVGYGFPEFVDRCRTELAVKLLLSEDLDLAEVAEQAGFGSLQGMRNACKEYLGLLPSEIRSRLRPRFIRG